MTRMHAPIRRREAGVGLVEVMVAMVIGLFLIGGAITVFMQSRSTSRTADAASELQDVARFALDTIEPDLRMASFWGLTNRPDYVLNTALPTDPQSPLDAAVTNNCGQNWTVDLIRFIDARDNGDYDLDCAGDDPVGWSDVLIVRRGSSEMAPLVADRMQIQSNRQRAQLFSDGALPAGFQPAPTTRTHDLMVHAYYVGEADPSADGMRQFALRRQTLVQGAAGPEIRDVEIVRGIEDLQVQFGLDTDDDDAADIYVNPGAPELAAGGRPVSARVWLLAVAEDRESGFVDGRDWQYANHPPAWQPADTERRRVLVSKTVNLRNSRALL